MIERSGVPCPDCDGHPEESEDLDGCGTCWGDGWVEGLVDDGEDED